MQNTTKKIDLERLLFHANSFQTWLHILPTYLDPQPFHGGYRFRMKGAGGLKLWKDKTGDIRLQNFSHKLDIPSGNLYQVVCHLHGLQPKGNQADFLQACAIIAEASGQVLDDVEINANYKPTLSLEPMTPQSEEEWLPNQERTLHQSFDYQFHHRSGAMTQYFSRWGVVADTLKRYQVHPLRCLKSKKTGFTINFTDSDFAFAYFIGKNSNIKYKRPHADKEKGQYKEAFIQSTGNYVFGYDQLPEKGKVLIIAAGEKDTLVLNQHFNKEGIYAICFTSETTRPPLHFIQQLQERFDKVFTCFDNDVTWGIFKNTGVKMMEYYALERGIPYINIAAYSKQNDVADIYEHDGINTLKNLIHTEINQSACVMKRPNDPFSVAVTRSLELRIQQYIGENEQHLQKIQSFITKHPKLILQSRTGTGKSWAVMSLVMDKTFLEVNNCDYSIICVPTTAILRQLEADFDHRFDKKVVVIDGSSGDFDCLEASHSDIILSTYDSLHKIDGLIERSMLFVDEFHELRNAHGYRAAAVQEVFELMQLSKRCIALSATPLLYFAMDALEFDFKLCKVVAPQQQQVVVQPYIYEQGGQKDAFQHCLLQAKGEGTHIVRVNDVGLLEAFGAKAIQEGLSFDIFSSKRKQYKEENSNYQSIMKSGKLSVFKKWIGTTALFDAGASFRFPVASINFLNPREKDSFVQHLARPRYGAQTGMNQELFVRCYHSQPKHDKPVAKIDIKAYFQSLFAEATLRCVRQNVQTETHIQAHSKYQEYDFTYWSNLHGEWRVDQLAILNHIYELERQNDTIERFYQRIQYEHPHIKVLPPIHINLEEDATIKQHIQAQRDLKKEWREQAQDLVSEQHIEHLMEAVWHSTNNAKLKRSIQKRTLIHPKQPSDHAQQLIDSYKDVFREQLLDEWMIRACKLLNLGFKSTDLSKVLLAHPTRPTFQHFYNRVVTHFELRAERQQPEALSGKSLLRLQGYHALIDTVKKWKDSNRKRKTPLKGLTLPKLHQLVAQALDLPHIGQRQALMAVKELYHISSKRHTIKGKKHTLYTIQERVHPSSIFQTLGLDIKEHYQRWKDVHKASIRVLHGQE